MREVKFRGKRLDNGEWVYGYYVFDAAQNIHQICTNHKGSCNASYDYLHEVYLVDPSTVGQFTGLRIENDVDVYEGDILRSEVVEGGECLLFRVFWLYDGWCAEENYDFQGNKEKRWVPLAFCVERGSVIGNIHDNPDLMEVAE